MEVFQIQEDTYLNMLNSTEYLEILNISSEGLFIYDHNKDEIHFSNEWKKRLGIEYLSPKEAALAIKTLVHPDDIADVQSKYLHACQQKTTKIKMEFRIKTVDSGYIWILSRGKIIYGREDNPVKYFGTHTDISERKEIENKLAFQALLLDSILDAICAVDENFFITYWNATAEKMFGWTAEEVIGKPSPIYSNIPGSSRDPEIAGMMDNGFYVGEAICYHKNGTPVYTKINAKVLKNSQGEYKGNVASFWDITGQKNTEQKAEAALQEKEKLLSTLLDCKDRALDLVEKLRQQDQNKNTFLNMLSHELRNPLASIMMSLSLQDQVPPGGEEDRKARKIMERQTAHLSRLVDDLLDVTRITQNKITLKRERVELNQLVRLAVADYQASFIEKEVGLKLELFSDLLYLEADPARLTQVIGNLLHNAAKFTNKGDQVLVTVSRNESVQEAIIMIQDNGIGIKPEILPNLFEPFMQVDSTLNRSRGGLGLGLAIVRGMVELHEGSASIHSEGLGKGTQLTIRLPLAAVEPGKTVQESKTAGLSKCSFRTLIIDDIPDIADILSSLLVYLGHEVAVAFSGPEGIDKAKEFQPEVVICDIGLPGMNGYEVARSLRSDKKLKDIFLIALSGYAQPEDLEQSREAGFNTHLAKPVNLDILKQTLAEIINLKNRSVMLKCNY